jgi:hypothetical protein
MNNTNQELKTIADIPIFFIVGRERSGTSLLRSLFDANRNVSVPLECRFILNLYSKFHKKNFWTKDDLNEFYENIIVQPAFNLYSIDYDELKKKLLQMEGKNSYSSVCKVIYYTYKSWNEKDEIKLLGDKNPSYSLHLKKIIKLFPQAKFIHIIRDYRDNIYSMCKVNYESHFASSLAYRWKYYNKLIEKSKSSYPDIFYTIRYEDLVDDPAIQMKKLCDFVGIEYQPEMLEFYKAKDKILSAYPIEIVNKHQKSLFNPINKSSVNSWEKKLSEKQVKNAECVCGKFAENYNYKRKYKKPTILTRISSLPGIIYGHAYYYWISFLDHLPYRIKMKAFDILANIFNHYWKSVERVSKISKHTKD